MKKILRIAAISLAVVFFVLVVASVVIPYAYKDEIMQFATKELGSQINADISLSKVDVTLFGNFPDISIELHNVCAKSSDTFSAAEFASLATDTALYAERVLLSFNAMDFLFENYVIREIVVRDARVNFFRDSKSRHNWEFSIGSDSTSSDMFLELSMIRFRNAQVTCHDRPSGIVAHEWFDKINFSGKFQGEDFFVDAFAAFTNRSFTFQKKEYFARSSFRCDVSVLRDGTKYNVKKMKLETPAGTILANGEVAMPEKKPATVDMHVNVETTVKEIMKVLPRNIADSLAPYNLAANFFVEGNVKGAISGKKLPALVCNVACTKGNVEFQKTRYSFATKGELRSNDVGKLAGYSYSSSATTISTGTSKATVESLSVKNFDSPSYSVAGSVEANISDIAWLSKIAGYGVSGNVAGTISSDGETKLFQNLPADLLQKIHLKAHLSVKDLAISAPDDSPYDFEQVNGRLAIDGKNLEADSVSGLLRGNAFNLRGKTTDLIMYLLNDNVDAHVDVSCDIASINVTPFYNHYESLEASSGTGKFLGDIRFKTRHLDFEPYHLDNASALVRLSRNGIEIREMNALTMHGKIASVAVSLTDLPNDKVKCSVSGEFENVSAKEMFATFDNFNQDIITDKQIEGTLSGKVKFTSVMDSSYTPIYPTIDALADIEIVNGVAKEVETLMEIGKKMKMKEEFTTVSFSKMKNTIRIAKDTLYIPDMKINSTAFEMTFAGKHNIEDNNFRYSVLLYLKKTLSNMFHRKNSTEEDFGEIEKNNDGNFTVPLKISGTPDNYSVDYDFRKSDNIKKGIEQQKSEWQEIINGGKTEEELKKQEEKEKPIKSGFELEDD